jgi:hypothetical protein
MAEWTYFLVTGFIAFLDFIHHLVFKKRQHFGNWTCFCPQVERLKAFTHLGLLERGKLNHQTTCVSVATTEHAPEIRFCQWEIGGKFTIKKCESSYIKT